MKRSYSTPGQNNNGKAMPSVILMLLLLKISSTDAAASPVRARLTATTVLGNDVATASTTRRGGGKSSGSYSRNVRSLLSQRDEQAGEIAMLLSRKSTPSRFIKKAETLLTRYWAKADWQAREEILRTVRWLLSMARLESVKPPLNRRKTKRARRTLVQA